MVLKLISKLEKPFAKYRIQSEILAYLRSLDWVGHAVRRWGRKEARARLHLAEQLAREVKREEIAAELDVSVEEYQRIMEYHDEPQLLTRAELAVSSEEEWTQAQAEFLAHPTQDPLLFLREPSMLEVVREALGTLSEQEQLVITLARYEEMTPREISEILSIAEEHVCQIHREVVARLRQVLHAEPGTTAKERIPPSTLRRSGS
jgi:RNA polymerase sigma factor for flagellar operon FliA